MMNKDTITVLNIVFFFLLAFIIWPFLVLYKKIVFASWVPHILMTFAVFLTYFTDKLEKNNRLCNILDNLVFFVIFPSFFWTGISLILD